MTSADDINAALDASRQSMLRREARDLTRGTGKLMHFIPDDAVMDEVHGLPGGGRLLVVRDGHKAILQPKDGEYGG